MSDQNQKDELLWIETADGCLISPKLNICGKCEHADSLHISFDMVNFTCTVKNCECKIK